MGYMLLRPTVHAKRPLDAWLLRLSAFATKSLIIAAAILAGSTLANADSTQPISPPQAPQGNAYADSLLPGAERAVGAAINGAALAEGPV
ncbi:MAG: hypothetical protein M3Y56_14255, partial [Armatimonadota bacterium]|nr:hypothetical protein [Armatimonadota bacterium]